jgi:imidazolonepropionase-like amidohydrolase
MLEHGTYLVPTLVAPLGVLRAADAGVPIPENVLVEAADVVEAHRDSIRRAVAAGVKIAMGTDAGVVPHGTNLEELQLMAEVGMSPTDVLVATTRTAAELMGLDRELGTLEPGKRADLVVVAGDPLDFSDLPTRIERVYQDGRLVVGSTAEPAALAV